MQDQIIAAVLVSSTDTPFCLFACSNEPHTPWNKGDAAAYPPADLDLPAFFVDTLSTRENYSKYLAEITYYDWQVGQLLELLDKHNLADNTLVMVVSEQAMPMRSLFRSLLHC